MTEKPSAETLFKQAIADVSAENDADVVVFSGAIDDQSDQELIQQVEMFRSKPNVLLLLTTLGGSADSAFRIARCLQHTYDEGKVILFVDTLCKSAGTLLALGADEIVMSDLAELGPLDVQLSKSDELAEMTSGLTPVQALTVLKDESFKTFEGHFLKLRFRSGGQITTKTALEIAATLTIGFFEKIYEQLDPMRLGEYGRALLIAHDYGTRIATENVKQEALGRLIAGYPSHEFIIDREEAHELFHEVREPRSSEAKLARFIKAAARATLRKQDGAEIQFLSHEDTTEDTEEGEGDENGESSPGHGKVPAEAGEGDVPATGASGAQPSVVTVIPSGDSDPSK